MLVMGLMVLGLASTARAQTDLEQDPGYMDMRIFEEWFDEKPNIEVNLKGAWLQLVAEASRLEDPDLADMLHDLKSIQVRGFSLSRWDFRNVERRTADFADQLETNGWDTMIRVRQDDERLEMYARVHDGVIAGLMVMSVEEDEAVFMSIVGEINPEQAGRLGRKFGMDNLSNQVYRDNR